MKREPKIDARALSGLAAAIGAGLALAVCTASASAQPCEANNAARAQQGSTYLPQCRGFELASPALKNEEEVLVQEVHGPQVPFQAAREGGTMNEDEGTIAFTTLGALPESNSGGIYDQYVASSSEPGSGWETLSLQPESQFLESYTREGSTGETEYFEPNLSCGVEQTELPLPEHSGESKPQLPAGETAAERITNLYVWHAGAGSGGAPILASTKLISDEKPANGAESERGNTYSVDGATEGCKRVIFESEYQFLGAPAGSLYEWVEGPQGGSGTLRVASVSSERENARHEQEPVYARSVSDSQMGEKLSDLNELTSEVEKTGQEVSRVVFSAAAESGPNEGQNEVYLRETRTLPGPSSTETASTTEVSASQGQSTDNGAHFEAASSNGQEIFFIANYGLAPETGPSTECCDLYKYDTQSRSLVDLSTVAGHPLAAGVKSVLGISEDGSVVYFSATGQLVPGQGNTQAQNEESAQANVYAYQEGPPGEESELYYVSRIGQKEAGIAARQGEELDAISGPSGMHYAASRVSADGNYLLFATNLKVREADGEEYENRDQATNEPDYEYYEYSLESGETTCVSCNPDRAERPIQRGLHSFSGAFQTNENGYLQRNLSDTGQVFFDSVDPLVARGTNNTVNVYQWQPEEIEGCEPVTGRPGVGSVCLLDSGTDPNASYFADASANGENVYITTQQRLAPQDQDGLRDVYDVRVGGGIFAETLARCSEEKCQTEYSGLGSVPNTSESGVGGGNVAPPAPPPPGPGKGGVAAFTAHSVTVRHKVRGTKVGVLVAAPAAGRISISGKGLKTAKKPASKAGIYKLEVSLTAKERRLLKRHKHVKLRLHVVFAPSSGHASAINTAVTFK
ncbi:MAG TPA: hypothetical protein VMB51_09055 [Solirubrobacteraceae bacterium]|nr:hypothetical protein [Solirubrobacteraceae bacterium]